MTALRLHFTPATMMGLPSWSAAPKEDLYVAVKAAGYHGVQHVRPEARAVEAGLSMTGMGRVTAPEQARVIASKHRAWGFACTTLHVGEGLESDLEMDRLAGAILEASAAEGYPLHVETHRATITQDIRRTLDLLARFPDLTFNADLSHWLAGHEFIYGDFEAKVRAITPVLVRSRYIHGRVSGSSILQLPLSLAAQQPALGHFQRLWRIIFDAFVARAGEDDELFFAPELLPHIAQVDGREVMMGYATLTLRDGLWVEQSDRWMESLELCRLAEEGFGAAQKGLE